jgi:glutaredoxin
MIEIFTKDNCINCKLVLNMLFNSKKKFIEKSLDNEDSLIQLVSEGAVLKSAPILKIKGEFVYDTEEMKNKIYDC